MPSLPVTQSRLSLLDALEAARNADGGWGAYPGRPSNTEATSLALMALGLDRDESAALAAGWLARRQREDGSWSFTDRTPGASWSSSLAVLALGKYGRHDAAVRSGIEWMVSHRGRVLPLASRVRYWLWPDRQSATLDPDLNGWPWIDGTFSWVEPTAYAILALGCLGVRGRRASRRVEEGVSMILDRMCPGGGWNYGNSVVLGEELEPYADTTAIALMALQRTDAGVQKTQSFDRLRRMVGEDASGLTLALSILAHRLYGRETGALEEALVERYRETRFLDETRAVALAALALDGSAGHFGMVAE